MASCEVNFIETKALIFFSSYQSCCFFPIK